MGPAALATLCGFAATNADLATLIVAGDRLSAAERQECAALALVLVSEESSEWNLSAERTWDPRAPCWWVGARHLEQVHGALERARGELAAAVVDDRANAAGRAWREVLVGVAERNEVRRSCDVGDVRLLTTPGDLVLPTAPDEDVARVSLFEWTVRGAAAGATASSRR